LRWAPLYRGAMKNLQALLTPEKRPAVIADCLQLIDSEVASKKGLGGMAVKGAYAVVKRIKPGIIREAVDNLLDDFIAVLDPFYAEFVLQGATSLESFLVTRGATVADALLGVTDKRAQKANNRTLKKAYDKLRPTGVRHTQAAVPGLARVVQRHV